MLKSPLLLKSYKFSLKIVHLSQQLKNARDYVFSDQILRAGTSIGANIREANTPQSRKDFIAKMYIALKEAEETRYWLSLLADTKKDEKEIYLLMNDIHELILMLSKTIKTSKQKLGRK